MKNIFFLFIILSTHELHSQDKIKSVSFENVFVAKDTLYIDFTDELLLEHPKALCFKGGNLIWGQKNSFFSFDQNGALVDYKEIKGRGPGEFERAVHYDCKPNNSFSALDAQSYKISTYFFNSDNNKYTLEDEFRTKNYKTRNFFHLNNSFVTLNELVTPNLKIPALSIYDERGSLKREIGNIPENAQLQFYLEGGGGATKDNYGNIYYTFLGDHRVWKWNSAQDSIYIFNNKPDYFVSPERAIIKRFSNDAIKTIRYSYEITRVTGLFYVEPNLIVQQLEPDNYLMPGTTQNILIEVFMANGVKTYTSINLPNAIAFTYKDLVYIPTDFYNDLIISKGKTAALIGYKFIKP